MTDNRAKIMHSQLIGRMAGFGLLIAVSFGLLIYHLTTSFPTQVSNDEFYNFFEGFQLGLIVTLLLVGFFILIKWMTVLPNEKKLVQMYIKENDERAGLIDQKAGSKVYFLTCIITIIVAAVVAGYFSEAAFFALIGCVLLMSVIRVFLLIYYKHKL